MDLTQDHILKVVLLTKFLMSIGFLPIGLFIFQV